jgi:hypothetical protein
MIRDAYGITAENLAEQLADASTWDDPDVSARPQSWRAFGEPADTTPKETKQ